MTTLIIDPSGPGVYRVSGYAPAGGFGVGAASATLQTAALQSALDDAASYGQTNTSVGVVLLDVPEVVIEQAYTNADHCLTIQSRTALIGEHVRKNKIIIDSAETSTVSMIQTAQADIGIITPDTTGDTFTRSAGDFLADGFYVGQSVVVAGFVNGANNATHTVTALTATAMTVSTNLVTETGISAGSLTFIGKANNVVVGQLTLDGNASNRSGVTATTWGTSEHEGLDLKYLSDSKLHDLYLYNIGSDAVDLDSNEGGNFINNIHIDSCRGCGIHWSGSGLHIDGVIGESNGWYRLQSATSGVKAAAGLISWSGDGSTISNVLSTNDQRGIVCLGGSGGYNSVSNIVINQPGAGSNITGTAEVDPATGAAPNGCGQGIYVAGTTGFMASNITFFGRSSLAGEAGILIQGSTTRTTQIDGAFIKNAYYGVWFDDADGGQINNATLVSCANRGFHIDGCTPQDDIVINNAVIRGGCTSGGIRVDATSDSVRINNPIIFDVTAAAGIYFISAASDCTVNGGRITGCQRGIYMSGSGGDVDSISIKNIELISNTTAQLEMRNTGEANNTFLQNVFISSGPQAVSFTANTDTFEAENEVIELTADGAYTMSAAALISNSFKEGQILTLINVGSNTITLTNGNDFRFKGGANLALAQYDSVRIIRNDAVGDWVEI